MRTNDQSSLLDSSKQALVHIVGEGVKEAGREATKLRAEEVWKRLLPAVAAGTLSGPLAAGTAAIVSALAERIFKETGAIEDKLDEILTEPFDTAVRTVSEILLEETKDKDEERYANDRLERAASRLETAYTYTSRDLPEKRLLVRVYQCLVAALLKGGGAAMRRYLKDLRGLAAVVSLEAEKQKEAGELPADREGLREYYANFSLKTGRYETLTPFEQERQLGETERLVRRRQHEHRLLAAKLEEQAENMEKFCVLITRVHQNRREILRAPKVRSL